MRMMVPRNAKSKAGLAEAKSETGEAAPGAGELEVTVDMAQKALLGIDVDWADGKTLYIKSIRPGAIEDWNKERPGSAVRAGDRIVAVNGARGDTQAMVRECRERRELRLLVQTAVPVAPAPAASPEAAGASATAPARRPGPGASAGEAGGEGPVKKQRMGEAEVPGFGASLYSGMPAPDPEKDRNASVRARELDLFAEAPAADTPRLIAFLDIDGVLRRLEGCPTINVDGELLPLNVGGRAFVPEAMRALRFLVHRTGCGLVLSSEWRRDAALREEVATALRALGLPPMRGFTALLQAREEILVGTPANPDRDATLRLRWAERRSREVSLWLREHPEVQQWVALDDLDLSQADDSKVKLPDTLRMGPALVLCDPETGLTLSRARVAVEMLLRKPQLIELNA